MMPLVLVPGIQGRWEYLRRTVDALSVHFQVVTFSLRGDTIDDYVGQVSRALDDRKIDRAIVCGVSFGGLVALRFAANAPARTSALVLASTPAPPWRLKPRHQLYVRLPRTLGALFMVETPWRLRSELRSALPDWRARWAFKLDALRTCLSAPLPLTAMAARARMIGQLDIRSDCDRVVAPTLIVTGEPGLDRVVSASQSLEYIGLINDARGAVLERTGHIGTMTRPDAFAALVHDFVRSVRLPPPVKLRRTAVALAKAGQPDRVA
jgi:3-oxoadipate enol-lactonase